MIDDDYIKQLFFSESDHFSHNFKNKLTNEIIIYLENRYNDSESIKESIYRIYYNIEIRPICKICGNHVDFIDIRAYKGHYFKDTCCKECENKYRHQQKTLAIKNKYGVDNVFRLSEIKEKIIETNNKKYGCDYILQADWFIKYSKEIKAERYGDENYCNVEKIKATKLERYGDENYCNIKKIWQTMYKNNTFNTSKSEETLYNLLINIYSDVIRQYKSEKYPYYCDFYIPSLDLYIEFNGSWTHGGHAYNENDKDDKIILEKWQSKNTKYYNNAIETWTKRDVAKRNSAKENNLNYIEFWSIEEAKEWITNNTIL